MNSLKQNRHFHIFFLEKNFKNKNARVGGADRCIAIAAQTAVVLRVCTTLLRNALSRSAYIVCEITSKLLSQAFRVRCILDPWSVRHVPSRVHLVRLT